MKKKTIRDYFLGLLITTIVVTIMMFLLGVSGVITEFNRVLNGVDTPTNNTLQQNIVQFKQSILSTDYLVFMLSIQIVYFFGFIKFYESIGNENRTEKESNK